MGRAIQHRIRCMIIIFCFAILSCIALFHTQFARNQLANFLQSYLSNQYQISSDINSLSYSFWPAKLCLNHVRIYRSNDRTSEFLLLNKIEIAPAVSSIWERRIHLKKILIEIESIRADQYPLIAARRNLNLVVDDIAVSGNMFQLHGLTLQNVSVSAGGSLSRSGE